MLGFEQLEEEQKRAMLPLFVVGKWPRKGEDTIQPSLERCLESTKNDQPFIFGLTRLHQHANDEIVRLRHEQNGFRAWLEYLRAKREDHPRLIPSLILDTEANPRNIAQQARAIENDHGDFAVHVMCKFSSDIEMASLVAASVDDTAHPLFVLDLGYISPQTFEATRALAIEHINRLRSIDSNFDIVIAGSSYPKSAAEYHDRTGLIPIRERDLFREIGGQDVAIYGDHASIHPNVYDGAPRGWVPRIDYSLSDYWYFYRLRAQDNEQAYIECARQIVTSENWPNDTETWAEREILAASNGNPSGRSPKHWISVRVNQHLHAQVTNPPVYGGEAEEEDLDY